MDDAYALKNLAISMCMDALVNIAKNNKYAGDSRRFLKHYNDSWLVTVLDIEPSVLMAGAADIIAGKRELGSLVMKKEFVHHPLEGLYAGDVGGSREYQQW